MSVLDKAYFDSCTTALKLFLSLTSKQAQPIRWLLTYLSLTPDGRWCHKASCYTYSNYTWATYFPGLGNVVPTFNYIENTHTIIYTWLKYISFPPVPCENEYIHTTD